MAHYQDHLGDILYQHGWEITKRDDRGEWWEAEDWLIESKRTRCGLELVLSFLVDPQFEGTEKASAIWAVAVNPSPPIDRLDAEDAIALLSIRDIRFPDRLIDFVGRIDAYRNQLDSNDA